MKIVSIQPLCVNVSARTNWFFVKVVADNGLVGWGEASLNGYEPLLVEYVRMLEERAAGSDDASWTNHVRLHPHDPAGLVAHAAKSALEQALTGIRAQAAGQPIHALLGGAKRRAVRVYANINRRTEDRSPAGCAASAGHAVADGFGAVKIAPFDGVIPEDLHLAAARARVDEGLHRVAAIRAAVGPDVDVMIDCHWRLDEATAASVMRELAPLRLFWIECPISEHHAHAAANVRLRELANGLGMRMAGAEHHAGLPAFEPIIAGRWFDVVMPDVKYAGGFHEMLRIADAAAAAGVGFSPHNPTGPVCNMASLHLAACAGSFVILEYQHAESAIFTALTGGVHPRLEDGCFVVPDAPGLGLTIDEQVARAHPCRPVRPGLDPRLG